MNFQCRLNSSSCMVHSHYNQCIYGSKTRHWIKSECITISAQSALYNPPLKTTNNKLIAYGSTSINLKLTVPVLVATSSANLSFMLHQSRDLNDCVQRVIWIEHHMRQLSKLLATSEGTYHIIMVTNYTPVTPHTRLHHTCARQKCGSKVFWWWIRQLTASTNWS